MGAPLRVLVQSLVLACLSVAAARGEPGPLLQPGDSGPRFTYPDLRTKTDCAVEEIAPGKPLLLVFLQTACRSCVREVLAIKDLQAQGVEFGVLCVFLDIKSRDIEGYLEDYELPFASTWDGASVLADAYGVTFTPTSFLLGPDGTVGAVYSGFTQATKEHMRFDADRLGRGAATAR